MYKEAMVHIERDMDLVYLITTIQKLKAGLTVLLSDREELIEKAKQQYQLDCTLEVDEKGEIIPFNNKRVK